MLPALIQTLAQSLAVDAASIAWLARKLQNAELLPAEDDYAELTPLHAARLLVALLAAGRPIDAVAAVAAYERVPALQMIRTDGRQELDQAPIEDMPIAPGSGPAVAALSRSFVDAIAWFIGSAATAPKTPMPAQVSARRAIDVPLGVLLDIPAKPADPRKTITLVYGRRDGTANAMGGDMLEVYAAAPGTVLQDLADAMHPIASAGQTRKRGNGTSPRSAQLRRLAHPEGRNTGDLAARA